MVQKTENILVKTVPGSFELTFGANQMMENCDRGCNYNNWLRNKRRYPTF